MYNKFFLTTLSILFLTITTHAGKLVLEVDLSEEQKAAMKKTFLDLYNQDTTTITADGTTSHTYFSPPSHPHVKVFYPPLTALEQMSYVTILVSNIGEEEAKKLAPKYTKAATALDLHEIVTTPSDNACVYK